MPIDRGEPAMFDATRALSRRTLTPYL
jgi:hypothetical protein